MDRPNSFEIEMIPRGKIYCSWFEAILAAFEEICSRLDVQPPKKCEKHEQTLTEFASDCGDDESVWGYDGDAL